MKKVYSIFLLFLVVLLSNPHAAFCQSLLKINENKFNIQTADLDQLIRLNNNAIKNSKKGDGNYNKCLSILLKAYDICDTISELNYNIGVCYFKTERKQKAIDFFYNSQGEASSNIQSLLGICYQANHQFDKAISCYSKKLGINKKMAINKLEDKNLAKRIQECQNAKKTTYNKNVSITPLPGSVNKETIEFNPYIEGNILYYSSMEKREQEELSMLLNLTEYEKVKKSENIEGNWENIENLETNIIDEEHISLITKIKDEYVVYDSYGGSGDLKFAKLRNGKLIIHKGLKGINTKNSSETDICYSNDGVEAYFVSDREGSLGGSDIYHTYKNNNGNWVTPKNLGKTINTQFDENDVFLSNDGATLYFSSKGHTSIGGFDIFKSKKLHNGNWGKPENLGFPINSTFNEVTYYESNDNRFLASDREGGKGKFDIYKITFLPEVEEIKHLAHKTNKEIMQENPNLENYSLVEKKQDSTENNLILSNNQTKNISNTSPIKSSRKLFQVQIAASLTEMTPKDLKLRYTGDLEVDLHTRENWKWHRYAVGSFKTFKEARDFRQICGVADAFIIYIQRDELNSIYVSEESTFIND